MPVAMVVGKAALSPDNLHLTGFPIYILNRVSYTLDRAHYIFDRTHLH